MIETREEDASAEERDAEDEDLASRLLLGESLEQKGLNCSNQSQVQSQVQSQDHKREWLRERLSSDLEQERTLLELPWHLKEDSLLPT